MRIVDLGENATSLDQDRAFAFVLRSTAQAVVIALETHTEISRTTLAVIADLLVASAAGRRSPRASCG